MNTPSPSMPGPESKLETILRICRRMNSERDLDRLLDLLAEEAGSLLHCERISIFLLDADRNQLWSKVAMGLPDTIRVDSRSGIVGAAIESGRTIHVPDAYADPRFNPTVDARTGYRTRSILAEPLQQPDGKTIGVLQALNKIGQPSFDAQDARLIGFLAGQAAVALQTAEFIAEINRSGANSRMRMPTSGGRPRIGPGPGGSWARARGSRRSINSSSASRTPRSTC